MSVFPYSAAALKRSAMHFLTGKIISGILTLVVILLLVRILTVDEYGVYVILVAGMELVLAITSFGLSWVLARYLPDFLLHASGKILIQFVWKLIAQIAFFLVAGILLLLLLLSWLLSFMELIPYSDAVKLYLLVMLFEGLGRNIQENVLNPLLQQGWVQISLVARNLAILMLLGIMTDLGTVDLLHVVMVEIVASALGSMVAVYGLVRYLYMNRSLPGKGNWQPPASSEMWRIARHMYFSQLLSLSYSPQAFMFFIQHYLGVEATALFGFLRNLFGQILRYLPATLFFSLIRPKLVASYVGTGGNMSEVAFAANLVGKLSLFFLMPLLVFSCFTGDVLLNLLSADKFNQAGSYLVGLLLALIPLSQRQILGTLVVVSNKSYISFWGSLISILVLPLAFWLHLAGMELWSVIIAIIMSHIIYNFVLIFSLIRSTAYRPDSVGFFRLIVSALISLILSYYINVPIQGFWIDLFMIGLISCGFFLLSTFFINPFHKEEIARLRQLFNSNVLVK